MPDNQPVIAQAADGTQHVFPAGTDPAVIDGAMKRYVQTQQAGAFQQRPGGPVMNANTLGIQGQTPASASQALQNQANVGGPSSGATPGSVAKETLGGALSGMGVSETKNPVMDTLKNLLQTFGTMMGSGTWTGQKTAGDVLNATPPVALAKSAYSGLSDIYGGGVRGGVGPDPSRVAHGAGSLAGNIASLGLLKGTPEALSDPAAGLKQGAAEVMNEGPSKVRVLGDQHAHAIATQQHIAGVADAVHSDAQQAMASVAAKVDAAKPAGAFDKVDVGNRVKTAIGDTVADTGQLPKAVRDLLPKEPTGPKSTGPTVGGRHFDLSNPTDFQAYQKLKAQGAFTPEEIGRMEGTSGGPTQTFNELQQARSNIGRQMQGLEGAPKAAASAVYGELSKMLREGARDAGAEPEWIDANARYKNYMDDFVRSPLAKSLAGENATDIMQPLAGKSRMQVLNILSKYEPFGMDMQKFNQEVGGYNLGSKTLKLGEPTKRTALIAAISPKMAAASVGIPRMLRNPGITRGIMGEGFEAADISPKKIYPTKAAAAAALKGKTPPPEPSAPSSVAVPPKSPSLSPSEVSSSKPPSGQTTTSEGESAMEAARRGAPGIDPTLKSLRRNAEKTAAQSTELTPAQKARAEAILKGRKPKEGGGRD
jgi:hypothetical protein